MNIPLFPLPVCLLPQGYTQLRIFEPRYKRLVSESLKSGIGFGLCMLADDKKTILPIGTLTQIIDFETLDDGLLGISVQGKQTFTINHISVDDDGLKRGDVSLIDSWPSDIIEQQIEPAQSNKINRKKDKILSQTLKQILQQYPQHLAHYSEESFNDMSWVCQRWLEIIPLSSKQKYQCINSHDHQLAKSFLFDIIK
ncbi:LON peptidase substrate-binding domain-containing protein [Shewanella vesiculosa]|jgi:Lon protease-like protein|uniref:LON peptidase substrate-binding domain-containing protein n=1 Tax=Shewanella vesiculosa TaxID=518738 RepID=A0ABV0FLX0_9GAMM|nr:MULTISPECIES: LON peptidase substrate-binding domain-containing protein [Shewanella]MBB1321711.1 LON peptidase substrate-binding domain-containing protein [Shewanella sp. SR43-8]MBB1389172.1 LON peptidase substrate-binding domain-containing protein [Shewanella sp. SG44-6]MBB1476723.1 LON peptidase substrate-binding domain-containing protein [Shewanella sp. SG41-3]RPA55330.1 peptidase S16 [Shewanella vesiculosa]UJL43359.1 LON peptidase substrate-binding domain-containing protein [Shewanella |tara:strand:+ start:8915 stop:9505 length:591 start_codon:yes stop_codon:yes gene_type:complete